MNVSVMTEQTRVHTTDLIDACWERGIGIGETIKAVLRRHRQLRERPQAVFCELSAEGPR